MRVYFSSLTTPKDKSRLYRQALARMGVERTLSECREALSVLYGYSGWDELVAVQRRREHAPTPLCAETEEALYDRLHLLTDPLRITLAFVLNAFREARPGRLGKGPAWPCGPFGPEFWSVLEVNAPYHHTLVMIDGRDDYVLLTAPATAMSIGHQQLMEAGPGAAYCMFGVTMAMLFETVRCRPLAPFFFVFDVEGEHGSFPVSFRPWRGGSDAVVLEFHPRTSRGRDAPVDDPRIVTRPPPYLPRPEATSRQLPEAGTKR